MDDQALDIADNEVLRNCNIGSQTHRVLIAATVTQNSHAIGSRDDSFNSVGTDEVFIDP